jgi:hypothetical protein
MQFHVTIKVHDAIVLDDDKRLREVLGPQLQKVVLSDRSPAGGFFGGTRGCFFLLEIDDPADLYALLGPEIYSTCTVEAHPVIPWKVGGELFQQWGAEGR